jgi:predicted GH43/DUF377 family glycosyl hydrolase
MTYTAFGPDSPRIAAVSRDLVHWRRLGLVRFAPHHGIDLASQDNMAAIHGGCCTAGPAAFWHRGRSLSARVWCRAWFFPAGPDGCLDVYYGMADSRIGVARACLADLATSARAA